MGLFHKDKPVSAAMGNKAIHCLICGGNEFWNREVKINTTGMELLGQEWANESALGLVCTTCGYMHEFVGTTVRTLPTS